MLSPKVLIAFAVSTDATGKLEIRPKELAPFAVSSDVTGVVPLSPKILLALEVSCDVTGRIADKLYDTPETVTIRLLVIGIVASRLWILTALLVSADVTEIAEVNGCRLLAFDASSDVTG